MKFNKLNFLRKIDFWFFYILSPIYLLFLFIYRIPSRLIGRKKISIDTFSTISIFKFLGGGSLFILYPMIFSLKTAHPELKLRIYCGRSIKNFAESMGIFDEIIIIDSLEFFIRFFRGLLLSDKELVINLESNSFLSSILVLFLRPYRSLTYGNNHNKIIRYFYDDVIFYSPSKNIQNIYESLFRFYGIEPLSSDLISSSFVRKICDHLSINNLENPLALCDGFSVALAPFSSDLSKERELTHSEIAKIFIDIERIDCKLKELNTLNIFILGGGKDFAAAESLSSFLMDHFPFRSILNKCGKLSLLQSAYIASNADLFLTIDSGLNHIVRLAKPKRIVSFFGPTSPYMQLGQLVRVQNETVLYADYFCSPCVHLSDAAPCRGEAPCMRAHFQSADESKKRKFFYPLH